VRTIPSLLAADLANNATTTCYLLKVTPVREGVAVFGITTLDQDVVYDDGLGPVTYKTKSGYTAFDVSTAADMSVDNSQAQALVATYPVEGMTVAGISRGDYDSSRYIQYLVNYEALGHGHVIMNAGQVGQVTRIDDLTCNMEMRSLTQILKQNSIIELTSITCRARFGDVRCKMPLRWYTSSVAAVGTEIDRDFTLSNSPGSSDPPGGSTGPVTGVFLGNGNGASLKYQLIDTAGEPVTAGFTVTQIKSNGVVQPGTAYSISGTGLVTFVAAPAVNAVLTWSGTVTLFPDGFFSPGVVRWLTGNNAGNENEIESYDATTGAVVLSIPTNDDIQAGDTLEIRRDCDYSKAMCKDVYNNLLNMRAEPELPRADGADLQSPTAHPA
jgi:hypothetical protein